MLSARETFIDSMRVALDGARQTNKRYFILFPSVANAGMSKQDVHLLVPVIHEDVLEADEVDDIAFTVYPSGRICWGNSVKIIEWHDSNSLDPTVVI